MDGMALALAIHVLAVVLWIGGVSFVTTILMPAIRRTRSPQERLSAFLKFEASFAWQARATMAAAGLSGLYMIWRGDLWARFGSVRFWWMHAMVCVWLIFAVMLFLLEPFVLHRQLEAAARTERAGPAFDRMERVHRLLLALALITVFGAAGGAHGLF
jgi:uncharacterized membrane protein